MAGGADHTSMAGPSGWNCHAHSPSPEIRRALAFRHSEPSLDSRAERSGQNCSVDLAHGCEENPLHCVMNLILPAVHRDMDRDLAMTLDRNKI
jgi:hypothetical protein